jgi:hypothetical protein
MVKNQRISCQYSDFNINCINVNDGCIYDFTVSDLGKFSESIESIGTPVVINAQYKKEFVDSWQRTTSGKHPVVHAVDRKLQFIVVSNAEEFHTFFGEPESDAVIAINENQKAVVVNKKLNRVIPKHSHGITHEIWAFFNRIELSNAR